MKVYVKPLNPCEGRKLSVQHYRNYLVANGHEILEDIGDSEVVLVWSCAFRSDYRLHSLRVIKQLEQELGKEVIVAGCLPDICPEDLRSQFSGTVINWRDDEKKLSQYFGNLGKRLSDVPLNYAVERLIDDLESFRATNPDKDASFLDQFIKLFISEGCRLDCSYCSERRAFPPYHSFPKEELVDACRKVVERTGDLEVMLQADNVGDYGHDIGSSLPELIRELKTIHPDLKVGIQGFNPAHFLKYFDEMTEFIRNGDMLHLRLPIQSASTRILKRMNRTYDREGIDKIFGFLDSVGFTDFSTDVIVGFPGEEEVDFEETLQFVAQHTPTYVNLSTYMDSPTLPAYNLSGKVDPETKGRRITEADKRLSALGVYCNTEAGGHVAERQRRMGMVKCSTCSKGDRFMS